MTSEVESTLALTLGEVNYKIFASHHIAPLHAHGTLIRGQRGRIVRTASLMPAYRKAVQNPEKVEPECTDLTFPFHYPFPPS
jgi:hypothetical protein